MSARTLRRATMDLARLQELVQSGSPTIKAVDCTDENGQAANGDVFHWRVKVMPPAESVYSGATYDFLFTLSPEEYPFKPPAVRVLTPIFNPMVAANGSVCEGLLRNASWKPTLSVVDMVARVVTAVFVDYRNHDVLNEEASMAVSTATADAFRAQVQRARASDRKK